MTPSDEDRPDPELDELLRYHDAIIRRYTPDWLDAHARQCVDQATRWRRGRHRRRTVTRCAAAAFLLAGLAYVLWPAGGPAVPVAHLHEKVSQGRHLGPKDGVPGEPMRQLSTSFEGSGYVYLLSQSVPGGEISVAPFDSVQEVMTSNGRPVRLPTMFPFATEWRVLVCVTDDRAEQMIKSTIDGADLFTADRRTVRALSSAIKQALKGKHIGLVAFSDEVTVLRPQ